MTKNELNSIPNPMERNNTVMYDWWTLLAWLAVMKLNILFWLKTKVAFYQGGDFMLLIKNHSQKIYNLINNPLPQKSNIKVQWSWDHCLWIWCMNCASLVLNKIYDVKWFIIIITRVKRYCAVVNQKVSERSHLLMNPEYLRLGLVRG